MVAFSVTTSVPPSGVSEICAGPDELELNGRLEPAMADREPVALIEKPAMFPVPPSLTVYTRPLPTVTLIGWIPPDPIRSATVRRWSAPTAKEVTSLLPGSTASSH